MEQKLIIYLVVRVLVLLSLSLSPAFVHLYLSPSFLEASLPETASVQMKYAFLGTARRPVMVRQGQVLPSWPGAFHSVPHSTPALHIPPALFSLVAIRVPGTGSTAARTVGILRWWSSSAPYTAGHQQHSSLLVGLSRVSMIWVGHQRSPREMASTFESATRSRYRSTRYFILNIEGDPLCPGGSQRP